MKTTTPNLRRIVSLLAATFLAASLSAAEPATATTKGGMPFRHTIIDGSPDLTRPAKAVGDINGDGFIDLVCGGSSGLFWYDYPTWTKHVIDPFKVADDFGFCVDMQVGDINGDGRPDVIVGDYKRTHTVLWYENPGSPAAAAGPWKAHLLHTYAWHFNHDVELGDVNRDDRLDVLLRGPKGHTELLLQNTPDNWTPVMICQEPGEGSALADMDGDDDLDVVQANYWLECPADPVKGVWHKHPFAEGWADRIGVTVADLNRDGRPDIVMAPAESAGRLSWFEAPADPKASAWKEHVICADVDYVHTFKIADMNRDGAPDIIFGEMHQASRKRVGIFLNQGDSEHWRFQLLGSGGTHNLRVADLGNDGDLDVIGANWSVWIPPLPGQKRVYNGQDPLEIWEHLSAPATAEPLPLDHWTYGLADDQRADNSKAKRGAFGIDFGDLDGDGRIDIVSGGYFYRNPGGDITQRWPRVKLPDDPVTGKVVDAGLLFSVTGSGPTRDVIAQALPDVIWLHANDAKGESWTARVVAQMPPPSHSNGRTMKLTRIVPGRQRPDILLTGGGGTYLMQIPDRPDAGPWPIMKITHTDFDEQKAIGLADLDGDGYPDLILGVGNRQPGIEWWRNPGDGSDKWTPHPLGSTINTAKMIETADLNGDGRLDVVATDSESKDSRLFWFEAPADPATGPWTRHELAGGYNGLDSLSVSDLDHDGRPDIAVGETKDRLRLVVYRNVDGGKTWTERLIDEGKESHKGAQAVDLDSDGDPDLVSIAYFGFQNLHIWRNDAK